MLAALAFAFTLAPAVPHGVSDEDWESPSKTERRVGNVGPKSVIGAFAGGGAGLALGVGVAIAADVVVDHGAPPVRCSVRAPCTDTLDNGVIYAVAIGVFSVPIGTVAGGMIGAAVGGELDEPSPPTPPAAHLY